MNNTTQTSKVFYSWSSDNPNLNRLRQAIRDAINNLNSSGRFKAMLEYDEATRNQPGSPNIVESLKGKILDASIFICDLSLCYTAQNNKATKMSPNPNVVFEYGFATSVLGDKRCISFIDSSLPNNSIKMMPFDFAQNRISQIDGTNHATATHQFELFIETIMKANPPFPVSKSKEEFESDKMLAVEMLTKFKLEELVVRTESTAEQRRFDSKFLLDFNAFERFLDRPQTIFFNTQVEDTFRQFKECFKNVQACKMNYFSTSDYDTDILDIYKPKAYEGKAAMDLYYSRVTDYEEKVTEFMSAFNDLRTSFKMNLFI